ncbi:hypothetical protein HPB50_020731 [Hyalomma asiaticum]|uniref:Uncharacterized protein n=1 Tax=Hyalomma asiaticum TaxID=266040 RepID=A0ACB7TKV2_HYAAI|nr:hypothetical protein HPB50_020731 [Hyalomma asiaticum]
MAGLRLPLCHPSWRTTSPSSRSRWRWPCGTQPGQEDCGRRKPMSYPDVILMCLSIDSPDSLENGPVSWRPGEHHFCPSVPIVINVAEKNCPIYLLSVPDPAMTKHAGTRGDAP